MCVCETPTLRPTPPAVPGSGRSFVVLRSERLWLVASRRGRPGEKRLEGIGKPSWFTPEGPIDRLPWNAKFRFTIVS